MYMTLEMLMKTVLMQQVHLNKMFLETFTREYKHRRYVPMALLADVMALTCFSPRRAIILSDFYNWYRKDIL
jgi:hypothetical protein